MPDTNRFLFLNSCLISQKSKLKEIAREDDDFFSNDVLVFASQKAVQAHEKVGGINMQVDLSHIGAIINQPNIFISIRSRNDKIQEYCSTNAADNVHFSLLVNSSSQENSALFRPKV